MVFIDRGPQQGSLKLQVTKETMENYVDAYRQIDREIGERWTETGEDRDRDR